MTELMTEPTQKGDRRMTIGLILVSVTLAAIAQVTLKIGVNHVTDANGGELALNADALRQIATTWLVWLGIGIFGLSAVLWIFALSRTSLSFAYPFAALTYVVIVLYDTVRGEAVTGLRWGGVALIVAGIILGSRTPSHS